MAVDFFGANTDPLAGQAKAFDYSNALFDRATQMQAGRQYAGGDRRGAAQTLASGGNIADASTLESQEQTRELQQWKAQQDYLKQAAPVFAAAAQRGDNLVGVFDRLAPDLQRLGVNPQQMQAYRQGFQQDPRGMLDIVAQAAQVEPEFRTAGDEVIIFDKRTGKEIGRTRGAKTVTAGPEQTVYEVGGGGQPPAASPQAPAAPQAAPGAPSAPSLGMRNNNPGNIRASGDQWQGMTGADDRGFVQFDTPENGRRALERNLQTYGSQHGLNTVSGIINRWAPPSENPTQQYAQFVAQKLGVDPNASLDMQNPQVIAGLADAITTFEGGPQSASAPAPAGQPASPAAPVGARVIAQGAPKRENAPSGYRYAAGGELEAIPGGPADPAIVQANKTGGNRKAEGDLRSRFDALPEVKAYREVSSAYRNLKSAANLGTAAGDMSMTFGIMKMLDPTSVVREGEYATAQNATGVPDRIVNYYNRALKGTRLGPSQRAEFLQMANGILENRKGRFDDIAGQYRGYAQDYGVDPEHVVSLDRENASAANRDTPPAGAQQGRDGGFYVEDPNKKGSFPRLTKGPNGRWQIKSANGKMLEWQD